MRRNNLLYTAVIAIAGAGIAAAGCATDNGNKRASAREIGLAEFSQPANQSEQATEQRDASGASGESHAADGGQPTPLPRPTETETATAELSDGGANAATLPQLGAGPATTPNASRLGPQPGARFVVDSLIGQINGRPIYADSFFQPIEDQLRAIAARTGQREFLSQANEVITQHLGQIVRNELFLADARAQLSQQQQQGLFAWMRAMREQTILEGGGTATAARQRLQDQQGMTMDEYLAARRDMALLHKLQEERITPRVIVSWRDIEREYDRLYHEFNPPARMKVLRIRLSTERDAGLIETATEKLAAGANFTDVAEAVGIPDGGAWQQFQLDEEGVDGLQLSESIKQHLRGLDVGETSEPFEVGSSTWWLHVAEIDQPEGRSLYDPEIQRMLHDRIWQRRFNEELNRYITSLFAEGVEDELDKMRERLLIIAFERYGP